MYCATLLIFILSAAFTALRKFPAFEEQATVFSRAIVPDYSYQQRIEKGRKLNCLMQLPKDAAAKANGGLEAEVQDWGYWELEGWVDKQDSKVPYYKYYLDQAFADLDIDGGSITHSSLMNSQSGIIYPDLENIESMINTEPTGGKFYNSLLPSRGVLIADNNWSPLYMLNMKKDQLSEFPINYTRIVQWSDMAFLQWQKACSEGGINISELKYVIRAHIINEDTIDQVFEALRSAGKVQVPKWDERVTFTPNNNPDEFFAILGSKNGSGVGYLLLSHKEQLGVKRLTSVTIWNYGARFPLTNDSLLRSRSRLNLLFEVEDVF